MLIKGKAPCGTLPGSGVKRDWTVLVGRVLEQVEGLTGPQAACRIGVSAYVIHQWRRKRRRGEQIRDVRKEYRVALLRYLDSGGMGSRIPMPSDAHRSR
jgi:hypothetical protein